MLAWVCSETVHYLYETLASQRLKSTPAASCCAVLHAVLNHVLHVVLHALLHAVLRDVLCAALRAVLHAVLQAVLHAVLLLPGSHSKPRLQTARGNMLQAQA